MTTMKMTTPTVVGSTVLMSASRVARSMAAREDSVTSAGGALLVRDWGVDQRGKLESGPTVVRVGRYRKPGWNTRLAPAYTCRVTYIQACDIYRRVWSLFNKKNHTTKETHTIRLHFAYVKYNDGTSDSDVHTHGGRQKPRHVDSVIRDGKREALVRHVCDVYVLCCVDAHEDFVCVQCL